MNEVTTSGFYAFNRDIDDDLFMSECWRRTQNQTNKSKCDTCDLRFKCYTQSGATNYEPQELANKVTYSIPYIIPIAPI